MSRWNCTEHPKLFEGSARVNPCLYCLIAELEAELAESRRCNQTYAEQWPMGDALYKENQKLREALEEIIRCENYGPLPYPSEIAKAALEVK